MSNINDFLNEKEIFMHDALSSWCDCNREDWCDETCPFYTDENEGNPDKMHWCHVDGIEIETNEPHPVFLDALYRDYAYYVSKLNKPNIGEGTCPNPVNTIVNHPEHYNQGDIECIDAMISAFGKETVACFCIVNAFKYNWRSHSKNGIEDIDKAIWYLNKYKELTNDE